MVAVKECNAEELRKLTSEFYLWNNHINNPNYNPEKAKSAFVNLTDYFEKLLSILTVKHKVKERSKTLSSSFGEQIPKSCFITEDTEFEVSIGLFGDFYVIWEITNCDEIKDMKDDFWMLLFQFASLGKFDYKEDNIDLTGMRERHKPLFTKRGKFYRLFRNYFLTQVEYGRTRRLGYIGVNWDNHTDPDILIENIIAATGILYKMNKMLWLAKDKKTNPNTTREK